MGTVSIIIAKYITIDSYHAHSCPNWSNFFDHPITNHKSLGKLPWKHSFHQHYSYCMFLGWFRSVIFCYSYERAPECTNCFGVRETLAVLPPTICCQMEGYTTQAKNAITCSQIFGPWNMSWLVPQCRLALVCPCCRHPYCCCCFFRCWYSQTHIHDTRYLHGPKADVPLVGS